MKNANHESSLQALRQLNISPLRAQAFTFCCICTSTLLQQGHDHLFVAFPHRHMEGSPTSMCPFKSPSNRGRPSLSPTFGSDRFCSSSVAG